ncbi:MAG: endonuclease III [Bacteroidales bacterium]|nr:endonuclease III [Bacteroidales bacterium]
MTKKERYTYVLDYFRQQQPNVTSELQFNSPFQLLVAVILSAQCTDKRVNAETPALFARFPDAKTMSMATIDEIYQYIKRISYPNNKARHLKGMAVKLQEDFNGVVPNDIQLLQTLPGVGRKTANVVAAVAFDQPTMAVDTHVFRVSNRIGLVNAKNVLETEKQLIKNIPTSDISTAHHWLLLHGRYICMARKPKCPQCAIQKACLYFQQTQQK